MVGFLIFLVKAQAEEERAKASEEKFQKLKTMYTSIRDEHIALLRQVRICFKCSCARLLTSILINFHLLFLAW